VKWPRIVAALAAALTLALVPGLPAAALPGAAQGVDDFEFESMHAEYALDLDSSGHAVLRVTETIVALFPPQQNRGIVRALPLKDGDVPLRLEVESITDEHGTPWHYERTDSDGFAELALGTDEYLSGRTTFVIAYVVHDTVRHFADSGGDEFYWDVNGDGWAQRFGTVSARILLGPALAAALTGDAACYVGGYGDTARCELESREPGDFSASVADVAPHSTVTVSIGFEGGTVVQPPLPRDSWIVQIAPKVLLGLLVLLLVLSVLVRILVLRDAPGRGTVIAEYTPPEDADLLLDADVVARRTAGLPALLVDFAVRGMVRILDNRPGDPDIAERRRFGLELMSADGASVRELAVLITLFGASLTPGKRVRPGELAADVGATLYGLVGATRGDAVTRGYRVTRTSRWRKAIVRASGIAVLGMIAAVVWAGVNDVLDGSLLWLLAAGVVIALAVPNVLAPPPRLTRKGAALRDHLLGMRLYLTVAEEERLRVLQSPEGALRVDVTDRDAVVKLYERLLPYAVLWGVEDQWVEKLRAAYPTGAPDWLDGDTFDSAAFSSFTSSSVSAVRPLAASSSGGGSWSSSGGSSSSSGSSGGGFAGGGGGGGGGGGR
jgi:uncharacterized membrane protein YgcG